MSSNRWKEGRVPKQTTRALNTMNEANVNERDRQRDSSAGYPRFLSTQLRAVPTTRKLDVLLAFRKIFLGCTMRLQLAFAHNTSRGQYEWTWLPELAYDLNISSTWNDLGPWGASFGGRPTRTPLFRSWDT